MKKFSLKVIPKKVLLDYWEAIGDVLLPFLQEREITIEQVFGTNVIYRRHPKGGTQEFIYIDTKKEILEWGYKHTYSFHPYICPLKADGKCWFVLDIDPKESGIEFKNVKQIAQLATSFFREKGYNFLMKFCGKNGVHFLWAWDKKVSENILFETNKNIIKLLIMYLLDTNLGFTISTSDANMRHELLSKGKNIVEPDSADIILDAKILHHHGNIRSPFSIHPATGLVSVPLGDFYVNLEEFKPEEHATLQAVMSNKSKFQRLFLPVNSLEL